MACERSKRSRSDWFAIAAAAAAGALVVAAGLPCTAAKTTHYVGDDMGWKVPEEGNVGAYDAWAESNTFVVGDTASTCVSLSLSPLFILLFSF